MRCDIEDAVNTRSRAARFRWNHWKPWVRHIQRKTWKFQSSTRIWQKYSSPRYKMITQGTLTAQLLPFEEHFKSLADVPTSFHLPLYTQQDMCSHTHPNKNR
jgi:hypothetical protein